MVDAKHTTGLWQKPEPIDTAPTDGTEVLAFKSGIRSWLPVRWLDANHPDYQGEFFHHSWDHTPMEDLTHWLPMPAEIVRATEGSHG